MEEKTEKSKEFEFFVKTDLSKYKGKYAAIVEDKVVASGDNAKEVLEEAEKKFPDKKALLVKIPKEEALILANRMKFIKASHQPSSFMRTAPLF